MGGGRDREGCSLPNGIRPGPVTSDVVASSRDQPNQRAHSTNAGTVTTTHGLPRRIAGNAQAGLNLEGTELVALSACNTGQGTVDYTEGVYGLVRAFRVAGARRVLMTLWPVEDAYAKTFMLRFYANWLTPARPDLNPNRDPVIALQQTRLEFLTDKDLALREPRVWAPYVLVRDARRALMRRSAMAATAS